MQSTKLTIVKGSMMLMKLLCTSKGYHKLKNSQVKGPVLLNCVLGYFSIRLGFGKL